MFYKCGTDKYSRVRTTCARNAKGLQTDPLLWDYEDCLSDNLVSYQLEQSTYLQEADLLVPPVKIPLALLVSAQEQLTQMEEDGNIINEEEHCPWVLPMLVIDKRNVKEKSTPPSKNDVRRDLY